MGTDICFPVAKYSHATGVRANNSVPWSHVQSPNLFVIVKGTDKDMRDEKLILRIVQGNDVLESLDVGALVDDALAVRRTSQSTGIQLYKEQLPIFGMFKDAITALRYTTRDRETRRLQMRLHTAAECQQIVHAFQSRGMEFQEQRPGTARPGTARPMTARPSMMSSEAASPPSGPGHFQAGHHHTGHPLAPLPLEAGSLSQTRLEQPPRQHEHADSQAMPPPRFFTRDKTSHPGEAQPARPSTAQISRSHAIQPHSSQNVPFTSYPQVGGDLAAPCFTVPMAGTDTVRQGVEHSRSSSVTAAPEPQSELSMAGNHTDQTVATMINADLPSNDQPTMTRPATASSFVFADTLEHEIPPPRKLPFKRPDSKRSDSNKSHTRPRSALALPPLPKPRLSPQNSSSGEMRPPSRPILPARPQTSSPLKRSYGDMSGSATSSDRPSTASPQKMSSPTKVPSPQAPAKKPGRMEQLLSSRKTSLQQSSASKVPRVDSLADAPGEEDELYMSKERSTERSPSKAPAQRDSMSPLRQSITDPDPTVNAYNAISSAVQRSGSLLQYAEQSLEDRQAALDEFMVQNLENPDFVVLCRDVENCWKRIALGL